MINQSEYQVSMRGCNVGIDLTTSANSLIPIDTIVNLILQSFLQIRPVLQRFWGLGVGVLATLFTITALMC